MAVTCEHGHSFCGTCHPEKVYAGVQKLVVAVRAAGFDPKTATHAQVMEVIQRLQEEYSEANDGSKQGKA